MQQKENEDSKEFSKVEELGETKELNNLEVKDEEVVQVYQDNTNTHSLVTSNSNPFNSEVPNTTSTFDLVTQTAEALENMLMKMNLQRYY
jgi:hypothetical protein